MKTRLTWSLAPSEGPKPPNALPGVQCSLVALHELVRTFDEIKAAQTRPPRLMPKLLARTMNLPGPYTLWTPVIISPVSLLWVRILTRLTRRPKN